MTFGFRRLQTYLKLGFRPHSADGEMQARWDKLRDQIGEAYFEG